MASGSGTAGSQSSVGESEGQSGPGAVDPKFPLWAYVEKLIPTAAAKQTSFVLSSGYVFYSSNLLYCLMCFARCNLQ